ncbi:MAG TPA: LON peptidase substrate-binding domain-containing protein [Burkholderiales bacterium]|nr:LON peptidase substrate-binding domain-containing protein [Burkholderiales bacterium]
MSEAGAAELPLFPLQTVLFPGGRLPLRIFEQRYLEMTKACLREGTPFGVCLIREGREVGEAALPEDVGCTARIVEWDMPQFGVLEVVARGERRFRIRSRQVQPDGLARAGVDMLAEAGDASIDAGADLCARVLRRIVDAAPAGLVEAPPRYDSAAWVSARLAELLPLSLASRQRLLEMDEPRDRLEILRRLISASGQ